MTPEPSHPALKGRSQVLLLLCRRFHRRGLAPGEMIPQQPPCLPPPRGPGRVQAPRRMHLEHLDGDGGMRRLRPQKEAQGSKKATPWGMGGRDPMH